MTDLLLHVGLFLLVWPTIFAITYSLTLWAAGELNPRWPRDSYLHMMKNEITLLYLILRRKQIVFVIDSSREIDACEVREYEPDTKRIQMYTGVKR